MAYRIAQEKEDIALDLVGGVTARDVDELAHGLAAQLKSGATVRVRTRELEDIDTSILQMLVSLRKTVAALVVEAPSDAFVSAVDRCALRRELLSGSKETL